VEYLEHLSSNLTQGQDLLEAVSVACQNKLLPKVKVSEKLQPRWFSTDMEVTDCAMQAREYC